MTDADYPTRAADVVAEATMFDDWMDRYGWLIDQARSLPPMDPALKTDAAQVRGCQSRVWMHATPVGDTLTLEADADAEIPKGIAALLVRVLSGLPAREIARADLAFLDEIGLREHLSPKRATGLDKMVERIRTLAAGA